MPATPDPAQALTQALAQDRGRILAALLARTRDFALAEEALQDATEAALVHWTRADIPQNPMAWLIRVAFRKAIDRLRAQSRAKAHADAMAVLARDEAAEDPEVIADERLRLIFTCCHPALEPKSQVALTLRTIAGLSTAEIARTFLDTEPTMGQRLSRAKTKLAHAGIAFAVPGPEDWADRLHSVLAVTYLIFNAGYTAGPDEPRDLCAEAIYLARLINDLSPDQAEVEGCLALMLITHARAHARTKDGASVAIADQDRRLWDHAAIVTGLTLIDTAMSRRIPGPYQIKAAIAACHIGESPDWPQIAALYDSLLRIEPTPVVQLNRAVALAETGALAAALHILETLAAPLQDYQPYHAARAEYLARSGQPQAASAAYDRAIDLAASPADRQFLHEKRRSIM